MGSNFLSENGKGRHVNCQHARICSVCSWIEIPSEEQKLRKLYTLQAGLEQFGVSLRSQIEFLPVADQALRDRVDLVYESGVLGFYQRNQKETFQVESCPLMSPPLHDFYQDFRRISIPIRKGSLRLRVSADGKLRGMWLDFANEDVRDLLAEKKTLQSLLNLGFVEIGQRRKKLGADFKLHDPEYHSWTRTWIDDQAFELKSLVGAFSQSGDRANRVLIRQMQKYFRACESRQWVEFGSGNGNLTFPLAGSSPEVRVKALEFDSLSLQGLAKTLASHPSWSSRIELYEGDFQRRETYRFSSNEGVLVNPPRSGLMKFLDPLFEVPIQDRPRDFVYMSCHPDSFLRDAARLLQLQYGLQEISVVDQFPHSPHFEILSRWLRT